jgi:uncharacterized protein Yka (UPF0111/DUF47 family)
MGLITRYLLPKEIDFSAALLSQAQSARLAITKLYEASRNDDADILEAIPGISSQAAQLKTQNMSQLLSVFITPYDKESIYRMITQLDWIALSVRHFYLETEAYDIDSLRDYQPILKVILDMAKALEEGVAKLPEKKLQAIDVRINQIYEQYNQVVEACAHQHALLLKQDDLKRILLHKEMLVQLKEIARRIHISANSLEDMAIKIL